LEKVVLLILESLGSTELLFILVMALVFFGPRKLPQLSRTLGKNLAEFRKASEDFKQTWEKEVNLEQFSLEDATPLPGNSHNFPPPESTSLQSPSIAAITPDRVIARDTDTRVDGGVDDQSGSATSLESIDADTPPAAKHDWL
jgi:Tat protein translocase TatB subunit